MTPDALNAGLSDLLWFTKSFPFLLALHLIQVIVLLLVVRFADFNEREPIPVILGMFLWGGMIATAFSAVGNGIVGAMLPERFDAVYGAAISAPLVEEFAKGAAIGLAFWATVRFGRRFVSLEFGGVTDGIVYGAAVGAGFGFFENVHYFANIVAQAGMAEGLANFSMRTDLLGLTSTTLLHVVATALTGAGLGLALWATERRQQLQFIGAGFGLAVLSHMSWNGLVSFLTVRRFGFDAVHAWYTTGVNQSLAAQMNEAQEGFMTARNGVHYLFLAAMITAIVLWLRYETTVIRTELAEEVPAGLLTAEEHAALTDLRGRSKWYATIAKSKRFQTLAAVREVHDKLIELALEKWRVRKLGADGARVAQLRGEIQAYRELAGRIAALEEGRVAARVDAPAVAEPAAPAAEVAAAAPTA